jgi:hypothetical protein
VKGAALRAWLLGQLRANLDMTFEEHCEALEAGYRVKDSVVRPRAETPSGYRKSGRPEECLSAAEQYEQERETWG